MSRRRAHKNPPNLHGLLLVDKPAGMTSHDVVDAVRRIAGQRQVGHTGTLDPAATGLLALCLGEATKLAEYLTGLKKVYSGRMRLGAVSSTQDAEGEITPVSGARAPSEEELRAATRNFLGEIEQIPPAHSAKKVDGRRLYEYARAGETVEVKPRIVRIHRYDILNYEWPEAAFETECGSGTYVRRLVHDLGEDLGCGAYLSALRRLEVGAMRIEEARTLDTLRALDLEGLEAALYPVARALAEWPVARITPRGLPFLQRGHAVPAAWAPFERPAPGAGPEPDWLAWTLILDARDKVLAIARYVPAPFSPPPRDLADYRGAWLQPVKRFLVPLA